MVEGRKGERKRRRGERKSMRWYKTRKDKFEPLKYNSKRTTDKVEQGQMVEVDRTKGKKKKRKGR